MHLDWFDHKNPDYPRVFAQRTKTYREIRAKPELLPALRAHYKDNPADFISDWGCTFDPRNIALGLPPIVPFILFPRQRELVNWILARWRACEPGVSPKSRESGASWVAIALSCTLCLFNEGVAIGWGSRKEEYVDKLGAPKSLFWKARKFVELLPPEFRGNFDPKNDAPYMRIMFRDTESIMTGEAGDNIGRGDRASIYFVDEAAYLERPETVDAALSQTTTCRIDISTANGLGNPFHRKVVEWPEERVFRFHWRDDPRKDEVWYQKQLVDLDPVTIAQEIDIDFASSVEGVLIPSAWVQAAIDAHVVLDFKPTGSRYGALDVADEGKDLNAYCGAHGVVLEALEEWSGKGDDIFGTVIKVFGFCEEHGYDGFTYDGDGLGAGVRGDARVINEERAKRNARTISVQMFRGSAGVDEPSSEDVRGRKNEDYFLNLKAQKWWSLRTRFQKTFRAVTEGVKASPDELISIPLGLKHRAKLVAELSQPTFKTNTVGKIVINKAPDGTKSPNLADAVMIRMSGVNRPMIISQEAMRRAGVPPRGMRRG